MNFSDMLAVAAKKRKKYPGPDDCVSLYHILRSAKHCYPHSPYADIASSLIKLLTDQHDLRFFVLGKESITDVELLNHAKACTLSYQRDKQEKLTFEEAVNSRSAIHFSQFLSGITESSLSKESLHTHGFLRNEIAPLLEFELLDTYGDEPDYKEKYFALLAERENKPYPPLKGENYAIKREELLIAVLALIQQNQKSGQKTVVPTVTDLIDTLDKHAINFWPSTGSLPMSRYEAVEQLGFALNLFGRPSQDLESLRAAKKRKRKNIDKETVT
ncbi:hypothetical protein [Enterobacter roggenkampii]|uniref:hypothetical protein n=1 Tax=Enterobacter roggenkampii TaxID=1812935 RepID=UPI0007514DBA|nr:hypothetical protein [Enterobacter roggenkampii]KUR08630.1 hypothetical protein AWI34_03930 [Enterobacter roggenkampii]